MTLRDDTTTRAATFTPSSGSHANSPTPTAPHQRHHTNGPTPTAPHHQPHTNGPTPTCVPPSRLNFSQRMATVSLRLCPGQAVQPQSKAGHAGGATPSGTPYWRCAAGGQRHAPGCRAVPNTGAEPFCRQWTAVSCKLWARASQPPGQRDMLLPPHNCNRTGAAVRRAWLGGPTLLDCPTLPWQGCTWGSWRGPRAC